MERLRNRGKKIREEKKAVLVKEPECTGDCENCDNLDCINNKNDRQI